MRLNVTTYSAESQYPDFLQEKKFSEKKIRNLALSQVYLYLAETSTGVVSDMYRKKYISVLNCSTFLLFSKKSGGELKLKKINSCRNRLCPMCTWRRSLKTYCNMRKITDFIEAEKTLNYRYVFLTLTVRNCSASELPGIVDGLFKAFKRFTSLKGFKGMCKGFFRSFEITHNKEKDTYHPHFHMVCAVLPSYFTSRYYLSQKKIGEMWQHSCRLDYSPMCDIRRVDSVSGVVCEVAKYTVKDEDIVDLDDLDLSAEAVACIDDALRNRRLIAYGGLFRDLHKQLNLDDEENGDLVHVDGEMPCSDDEQDEIFFFWHSGYSNYMPGSVHRDIIPEPEQ